MANEKVKVELTVEEWCKINTALKIAKEYMNDKLKYAEEAEIHTSAMTKWYEESLQMLETISEEISNQIF